MGELLVREWTTLWTIRNKERHGHDAEEQFTKCKAHLLAQLEDLYTYKNRVLPAHRHLFMTDAQTHLNAARVLDSLDDWIQAYRPAILSSAEQAQQIDQYMQPISQL